MIAGGFGRGRGSWRALPGLLGASARVQGRQQPSIMTPAEAMAHAARRGPGIIAVVADDLGTLPTSSTRCRRRTSSPRGTPGPSSCGATGDRELAGEVAGLPKPTVAAWLLNQLARRRAAAVEQLVGLGAELREAQQSLDGDQMRALTRQRQQVVRAFSRQVAELGDELGRPVSGPVAEQVEETLRAAVADEEAGEALLAAG